MTLIIFSFQIPEYFLWSWNSGCLLPCCLIDKLTPPPKLTSLPASKPLWCYSVHHWLVNTVQRSPFLKNTVLTTGDSNFAIWRESVLVTARNKCHSFSQPRWEVHIFKWTHTQEGPIILSPNSEQMCTAACWSPSRPAVFYIGKEDGRIEVWNLLEKTSEPAFVQEHITNAKITCIKPWIAFRKMLHFNSHLHTRMHIGPQECSKLFHEQLNWHWHPSLKKRSKKICFFHIATAFSLEFYFCTAKQHFLAVTDEQGTLRVLEIPKNLRVASRGEVSSSSLSIESGHWVPSLYPSSTAWSRTTIDTCVTCRNFSCTACVYGECQTCWLPFFCARRAFIWKDTLGWRKMCWKIFSWSKNCGKRRRGRQLRPQRQWWDASEISTQPINDTD